MGPKTRGGKLWLGIATIWPFVWIVLFVLGMLIFAGSMAAMEQRGGQAEPPAAAMGLMGVMMVFHCLTIAGALALLIYYIVHAVKNPGLDQTMRIVWILLFFFMSFVTLPVYWFLYIWRTVPPVAAAGTPGVQPYTPPR